MFGKYGQAPDSEMGFNLKGFKERIANLSYNDLLREYEGTQYQTHRTLTEPDPAAITDNSEFRLTMLAVYQEEFEKRHKRDGTPIPQNMEQKGM